MNSTYNLTRIDTSHDPIDIHIGQRLKLRRKELSLSQQTLADQLGITFQQIQKYESAQNRISASNLYQLTKFLDVSVSYFYEGLKNNQEGYSVKNISSLRQCKIINNFVLSHEGIELNQFFMKIKNRKLRKQIINLIHCIIKKNSD